MSTYRTYRFCPNCDEYHKVEEVNEIPTCVFPPNRCTRCKTLGHLTKNHDRRYELKILEVQRDNSGISQNRHHTTRRNNAPRGGHSSTRQRNRGGNQSNRSRGTSNSHRHRNSARNQVQRAQSPVPNHRYIMLQQLQERVDATEVEMDSGFTSIAQLIAYDSSRPEPLISWPEESVWTERQWQGMIATMLNYPFNSQGLRVLPSPPPRVGVEEPRAPSPQPQAKGNKCEWCTERFFDCESWEKHVDENHTFPCSGCSKPYPSRETLLTHERICEYLRNLRSGDVSAEKPQTSSAVPAQSLSSPDKRSRMDGTPAATLLHPERLPSYDNGPAIRFGWDTAMGIMLQQNYLDNGQNIPDHVWDAFVMCSNGDFNLDYQPAAR